MSALKRGGSAEESSVSWLSPGQVGGPLPSSGGLDVSGVRAAGAGGLSLAREEGLTGAAVGESVLSRLLLQGHSLRGQRGATNTHNVCTDSRDTSSNTQIM